MVVGFTIAWLDERLLRFIHGLKSARVTGSFARGTPRNDSDLDIRLKDSDIKQLVDHLRETKEPFRSELPGHIVCGDGVEVYTDFHRQRSLSMETVTINGLQFKTW